MACTIHSDEIKRLSAQGISNTNGSDLFTIHVLTNNGALSHTLLSPKRHVEKEYRFECAEPLPENAEAAFLGGITLRDGYECKPSELVCDPDRLGGYITLTEGKYHQIKRMIAFFDNALTRLERVKFAGIPLDRSLSRGEWRFLTDGEIKALENKAR